MIKTWILGCGGLMLALAFPSLAPASGDPEVGRKLAGQCRTCHGLDGYATIPIAPHIGGEPQAYLVNQLTAFRDGTREHEMMTVVAKNLSDEQIADLSAWYANHTITTNVQADPAQAPAACVDCHGVDGIALVNDAPNLAGETNIYIETQLKAFQLGKRQHEVMTPIASELSEQEMRSVANWYANVKIEIE